MKKRILGAIGLLIAVGAGNASDPKSSSASSTPEVHSKKESELYIGALVGYSRMSGTFQNTLDYQAILAPIVTQNQTAISNGFVGSLLVGSRKFFGDYFLGIDIEFGGDTQSAQVDQVFFPTLVLSNTQFTSKLQRTFFLIPSLVAGVPLYGNLSAFLKLGVAASYFNLEITGFLPAPPPFRNQIQRSKLKFGFVPTLGLEYKANQTISFFTQVSCEWYQAMDELFGHDFFPTSVFTDDLSARSRIKPRFMNFKIGILFKL
jgi:opacity protein-like surface antigen